MLRFYDTRETALDELEKVFSSRLTAASEAAEASVREILAHVKAQGDSAVLEYTRRWDCPKAEKLRVSPEAIDAAAARVRQDGEVWAALNLAADRIRSFHEKQKHQSWFDVTSTRSSSPASRAARSKALAAERRFPEP